MGIIHLIGGEKGGVGKSWVARTMAQYFIDNGDARGKSEISKAFQGYEADRSNPSFVRIYGEDLVEPGHFSDDPKQADEADEIFEAALTQDVVVNLPAQSGPALTIWINDKGLVEMGKQHGISFVMWFVTDGENDSLGSFMSSIEDLPNVPHVLLLNEGRCDYWDVFDKDEEVQALIKKHNIPVVNFPKLADSKRVVINNKKLKFSDARVYDQFTIIGRNEVCIYLEKAYKVFESTGYLSPSAAKVNASNQAPTETTTSPTPVVAVTETTPAPVGETQKKSNNGKALKAEKPVAAATS